MNAFHEKVISSRCSSESTADSSFSTPPLTSNCSDLESSSSKFPKASLWSSFFTSAFSAFRLHSEPPTREKKAAHTRSNGWTLAVKRLMLVGSMRRIHERVLGPSKTGISSNSDIWLLGVCYKISQDESLQDPATNDRSAAFTYDFSSRILMTYRKGFDAIGDTRFTTDASWGCMLRSSQMLVAQALLFHWLGRSWQRKLSKPLDREYVKILHLFGDSPASAFSIHNLLEAGKAYGLVAGSWIGPYAMCCSWESLALSEREETTYECQSLPMAIYVVSGDANGERGGAPIVCIEDASRHCFEFSHGQADWTPILLLVPLVLGLEKVNPRYIPSLQATFTFPQSLGILGGSPGASTYIVGVQDGNAFYLDPHYVQQAVNISQDDLEADTSSYHCDVIRHIPLDSIDSSLAIGFYCRDKDDFDGFCSLASKLADESNGAPLFTVADARTEFKPANHGNQLGEVQDEVSLDLIPTSDGESCLQEDEWQLL